MKTPNPYTIAAVAGLTMGEKHNLLNAKEIDMLAAAANQIGNAVAKLRGENYDVDEDASAWPAPAAQVDAPPPPQG